MISLNMLRGNDMTVGSEGAMEIKQHGLWCFTVGALVASQVPGVLDTPPPSHCEYSPPGDPSSEILQGATIPQTRRDKQWLALRLA